MKHKLIVNSIMTGLTEGEYKRALSHGNKTPQNTSVYLADYVLFTQVVSGN
jgi:hypothetical protein